MRIIAVEPVVLGLSLSEPVRTSFGTMTHRYSILVRIDTDAGVTGWGESWSNFPAWSPWERVHMIKQGLEPLLLGEDPRQVAWLHDRMMQGMSRLALQCGIPGPVHQAISGVDIALWDLLGKELGQPVYRLFGGGQREVPVYASGLGPGDPTRLAVPLLDRGVTAAKLKVGFGLEVDRHNLAALRELLGPDRLLLTDANQAWELDTARQMLGVLETYSSYWLEEPLPADQPAELAELRRQAPFLLVAGENVYGRNGFRRLLEMGAVDLVQPDICKTGGLMEGRAICQMAGAYGVPYAPHYLGGAIGLIASLHLCAATPGLWRMELDANPNPLRSELGEDLLEVRNGCLTVPDGPGLGIKPSSDLISRYQIQVA